MIIEIAIGILLGFMLIKLLPFAVAIIPAIFGILALAALVLLTVSAITSLEISNNDLIGASVFISVLACFGFLFSNRGTLFLQRYIKPRYVEIASKLAGRTVIFSILFPLVILLVIGVAGYFSELLFPLH